MREAAFSTLIKARVATVFSFKTKFLTRLMDLGAKCHLLIFKEGCGWPEGDATAAGAVEPASDGATLMNK